MMGSSVLLEYVAHSSGILDDTMSGSSKGAPPLDLSGRFVNCSELCLVALHVLCCVELSCEQPRFNSRLWVWKSFVKAPPVWSGQSSQPNAPANCGNCGPCWAKVQVGTNRKLENAIGYHHCGWWPQESLYLFWASTMTVFKGSKLSQPLSVLLAMGILRSACFRCHNKNIELSIANSRWRNDPIPRQVFRENKPGRCRELMMEYASSCC